MPYYADLSKRRGHLQPPWEGDPEARDRAVARLLALREALRTPGSGAPPPRTLGTFVLGTWNVREFDSATWGERLPESYAYIAEIVDRFDLVAIQEVRDDLSALERLVRRLGGHWQWLVSDVTEGRAGNHERLAYLYDARRVTFLGVAGELVLPPVSGPDGSTIPAAQIARTPLMAAFQVGWTKFVLTTVHIVYGEDAPEPAARVEEIAQVARFLRNRTDRDTEPIRNFVLLGDFNIFTAGDATLAAITGNGFTIPDELMSIPGSNVPKNKKYDQIAYRAQQGRFEPTGAAGVFDYYPIVFTEADAAIYRPAIDRYIEAQQRAGKRSPAAPTTDEGRLSQYLTWRTYQLSDHLPLWAEFRVDFADEYLAGLAAQ